MTSPTELEKTHGLPGRVSFRQTEGGVMLADITATHAAACVSLNGGQVLNWLPQGETQAVVWLSPRARLHAGKSIRGGAPLCWPWFGPHAQQADYPLHGYARTAPWNLESVREEADGTVRMRLRLCITDAIKTAWRLPATLTTDIAVGRTLSVSMTTTNTGSEPITITEAVHTYLAVSDISAVSIEGLDGRVYADKVQGGKRETQEGTLRFSGETDRVFLDIDSDCVLHDPVLGRRIRVAKNGSRSTVVWNPWQEKAARMDDIGEENWRGMVCIESANALTDGFTLASGATHTLQTTISVER